MPARRSVAWMVPVGSLLVLALWLVAGCGGGGGEEEGSGVEEGVPPVTGSFVGSAQDEDEATDVFVAIVAAPQKNEAKKSGTSRPTCVMARASPSGSHPGHRATN